MGNEFSEHPSHSAEYFGDTRDYWWNHDYVELIARRWELHRVRDMLDVGCGVGHWGRLLGGVLPTEAHITGIDRDPFWIEKATERAAAGGQSERFHYQVSLAEDLPFDEGTFDLVTCQTVLIHARDPSAMLAEMIRVTRPGGLVAVAEPNNAASSLVLDAASFRAPVDEIVTLVRFQLICERGKEALGEGNNSAGEEIPALFAAKGLTDVRVYLNDKASPLLPPYSAPEQRANIEEMLDFARRCYWVWSFEQTRRYFVAGGGSEAELETLWAAAMAAVQRSTAAIENGTYTCAGGGVCYLVSGRKPTTDA
jgi:ubiquinone/menaquinone biosynthesis C-methylase UbiE